MTEVMTAVLATRVTSATPAIRRRAVLAVAGAAWPAFVGVQGRPYSATRASRSAAAVMSVSSGRSSTAGSSAPAASV